MFMVSVHRGVIMRILTLFLTKDSSTFVPKNYDAVLNQEGISQDVYVVSRKPVNVANNIVIPVDDSFPMPIRVGFSIRMALKRFNLDNYDYIFKVDGDNLLPKNYVVKLLEKRSPLAGAGCAFLIKTSFFKKVLKEYPVNYCDDGYVFAKSIAAMGFMPPYYDYLGKRFYLASGADWRRNYIYGLEHYRRGDYLFQILISLALTYSRRRAGLKTIISVLSAYATGFIHAFLRRIDKYEWWKDYRRVRASHFAKRFIHACNKILNKMFPI